jgi:hypothetical protein
MPRVHCGACILSVGEPCGFKPQCRQTKFIKDLAFRLCVASSSKRRHNLHYIESAAERRMENVISHYWKQNQMIQPLVFCEFVPSTAGGVDHIIYSKGALYAMMSSTFDTPRTKLTGLRFSSPTNFIQPFALRSVFA